MQSDTIVKNSFGIVNKFFLLFLATQLATQAFAADPREPLLRVIGTNLFNFSKAGERNHLVGEATSISNNLLSAFIPKIAQEFVPRIQAPAPGDTAGMLSALSKFRMAQSGNLSPAAAWSMGIDGAYENVDRSFQVILTNFPIGSKVGDQIDCYAVPTRSGHWDIGLPFSGSTNDYPTMFWVLDSGIYAQRTRTTTELSSADQRLLAWQMTQASDDNARSQFEIGQRYLNGKGVPTNQDLGLYWIRRAATNGYPAATNFLNGQPTR